MVAITQDWLAFESYAEHCRTGTFQLRQTIDGVEVRVRAGRLGFIRTFEGNVEDAGAEGTDDTLARVLGFCKQQGYIEVVDNIQDENFHKGA